MSHAFDPQAIATLYDNIADVYADFYSNYNETVKKQGGDLSKLIAQFSPNKAPQVLDCSCGIGTQAIGMALQGLRVYGGDISPLSIEQAKKNTAKFGVEADFRVMDMRLIREVIHETFDVVVSCGNSIAHLLTEEDLNSFFSHASASLNPNGLLMVALTNHEGEPRQEGIFYDPHVKQEQTGRTVNFQLWKWLEQNVVYVCDDYTISDYGSAPVLKKVSATFRIWRKARLIQEAEKHGFQECLWITPDQSGHHNPIFCAKLNK